jgi:hypothetical protein
MFDKNDLIKEELFDSDTRLNFVLTSSRTPNNISVDSIDVKTKYLFRQDGKACRYCKES